MRSEPKNMSTNWPDKATDVMDQAVDKGHEFIKDKQTVLAEAVEAGCAAMSRERERLSGEKTA